MDFTRSLNQRDPRRRGVVLRKTTLYENHVHAPNNNNNPWNSPNADSFTSSWEYGSRLRSLALFRKWFIYYKSTRSDERLMQTLDNVKNRLECFLTLDKEGLLGFGKRLMPSQTHRDPLRVKPLIIPAVWFKRRHTKTRQSDECRVYGAGRPTRTMNKSSS